MTSRERILRTLEFEQPDRVPRDLWLLPAARIANGEAAIEDFRKRWPVDVTQCSVGRSKARPSSGDPYAAGIAVDEWGCVFESLVPGVHGEVKQPLLEDYSRLPDIQPPLEFLDVNAETVNAFCRQTDKFVFASGWARPFERMQFLRGTENLMMDIAEDAPAFHELLDLVHGFFLAQYKRWAATEVDALVMPFQT